ncbi:JAB domain-containing protein [Tenacibaculum sp. 190524A02b]|uniref:JAB domain-containing protein n=1 Tax=Tenacibaculum vairaonense TaxID=3137860 RepID=UPI0032B1BA83
MKSKTTKILSAPIHTVELHYKRPPIEKLVHITNSKEAEEYIRRHINTQRIDLKEFFWIVLMTGSGHALGFAELGSGTTNHVSVSIREIFQLALISNASGIILCHNHPSGKLKSSLEDKALTGQIEETASIFSIKLIDHLIITSESYYSFQDGGLL